MNKLFNFDVIVVGGGHSGIEASNASSNIGCKTLLLTNNINSIGQMSCNPSIGGIGKSHLVKEIDALGGLMGIAADKSGIQFRKLNTSRGYAVQSTRVQTDKFLYQLEIKKLLYRNKNLTILQQKVSNLIIKNNKIIGVKTNYNLSFFSKSVVLSVGTFLNGIMFIGTSYKEIGGRYGDISSINLSKQLKEIFLINDNRLKTGTPPRLDFKDINYKILFKQDSDIPLPKFSFIKSTKNNIKLLPCYITKTNKITHEIISSNLHNTPIYSNIIKSKGPRYCPSIEDKIVKFKNKESHNIFLEPESIYTNEIYPNGISTSLPIKVQQEVVNSIKGLEFCNIIKPGYTVEYDFFDPKNLKKTLESKIIKGLFLSGQINGTTGYEEAAAQGIVSGINAAMLSKNKEFWIPSRKNSYIGVMIHDLCSKGVNEPYRIFTSRSEYRLNLREDNADFRLTEIGYKIGLISNYRWKIFNNKKNIINKEKIFLKNIFINSKDKRLFFKEKKNIDLKKTNVYNLIKNENIYYKDLFKNKYIKKKYKDYIYKTIEIDIKYENYINRQNKDIKNFNNSKYLYIKNIDFKKISGLSNEIIYILEKYKPKTIYEAIKISGITPSSILNIIIWMKNRKLNKKI